MFIVSQLLFGISNMNQKNLIHRDLKPKNILVSHISDEGPIIKIADFGYSQTLNTDIQDGE